MRVGRRARKFVACFIASLAMLLAWDQTGLLPAASRGTEVGGVSLSRASGAGDWDGVRRLRVDPALLGAASTAELAAAPTSPPVGDVAIAPPPQAFDAPAAPAEPPPAPLRRSRYEGVVPSGGTWAVMIGINNYPGTRHDLRSAVADAQDVNEALMGMGVPGDHRLMIRDGQATASTIRASVEWLNAHAGPDAIAVFFYAGHIRKLGGGTEAIVGADGETVTDTDLAQLLDGLQAKRAWIALAACYSGGFTEVLRPGRILTAASSANAVAYENEGFGRSYLVQYMVRKAMIEGAAPTSVEASFSWARDEIARQYPDRVPVQYDSDAAELDLRQIKSRPQQSPSGASGGSSSSPPPSSPPPSNSNPPNGAGGSGGGSGESPPPDPNDGCAQLTIGIIRCNS